MPYYSNDNSYPVNNVEQQDYGSGVYIYTDEHNITWECKYTEEGYAQYINGQTGESTWDDPCPDGYDGWHEMTITEWNAWNADPNLELHGGSDNNTRGDTTQYDANGYNNSGGHVDAANMNALNSPNATLGQRVRAQLARERALKSSRKKKKMSSGEPGATARDRVRRELAKARQATKDAEAMRSKLDVLQRPQEHGKKHP